MADTAVAEPQAPTLTDFQKWASLPEDQQLPAAPSEAEIDTAAKTAPASEPETKVEKPEDDETPLPKGLKKRFSELTGKIRELETQLAAKPAAQEKPGAAPPPETAKADQTGEPVAANFATYEEYVKAVAGWEFRRLQAETAAAAANQTKAQVVQTQVTAARAAHEDYDEVVSDQVPISAAMVEVMTEPDFPGAEVAYLLGKNPVEAARIAKLSRAQAGAALAKLAAQIPSTQTKPKAAVSQAPPPPKIVHGTGGNADPEPELKDFKKWNAWADREDKRKNPD